MAETAGSENGIGEATAAPRARQARGRWAHTETARSRSAFVGAQSDRHPETRHLSTRNGSAVPLRLTKTSCAYEVVEAWSMFAPPRGHHSAYDSKPKEL